MIITCNDIELKTIAFKFFLKFHDFYLKNGIDFEKNFYILSQQLESNDFVPQNLQEKIKLINI